VLFNHGHRQSGKLGFLNAPSRATAQHFYEQMLPIYISEILPIRYIGNIVISADIYQCADTSEL